MRKEKINSSKFLVIIFSILLLSACCSKKGACPAIEFNSFQLIGFKGEDVSEGASFIRYAANSNFTVVIDSMYYMPEALGNDVFKITTPNLPVDVNYGIRINKISKLYRVGNFTGDKIACGKCFMKTNNQYGFRLSGYSVNNKGMSYEDIIRINK